MNSLPEIEDGRLKFIFEYVMNAMCLKPDKIYKFLEDDKIRQMILDVFESSDGHMVFINAFGSGSFEVFTNFPGTIKGKGFYFIKREKIIIDKAADSATMYASLYVGDMYKSPIVHFHRFINLVMFPMLMNEKNRAEWPDTLSEYVLKDLHNLRKTAAAINAKMEGKTYLAHPVSLDKMEEYDVTHCRGDDVIGSLMYSIETTVINWTAQIAEVLEQDSGQNIAKGKYPNPMEEYKFWEKRLTCMYDIYTQMTEPKAKNMTLLLEKYNSAYAKPYKDTFKKVVRAYVESETIHAFLTPLMAHVENVEMQDFEEVKPLIQPLVHVVSLIWVNCEYYRKTERLVVLLIQICNLLINQSRTSLDPVEILKEEAGEGIKKVEKHLDILYHFRRVCDIYRNNVRESCVEQSVTPSDWGFHPPWVFARFNAYTERLELIKTFFKTCLDYNRMEKIDVLGLHGARLSQELSSLYEQYLEEHKKFIEKNMDCLIPNDEKFSEEIDRFMKRFDEYDNRLSASAVRSSETSLNVEGAFKTIFMFGSLLDRPILQRDFSKRYENLLSKVHIEIDNCKLVYDRQIELLEPIIPPGMPPISGSMTWAKTLKERAMGFMTPLSWINKDVFDQESYELLRIKYEELLKLLDGYYNTQLQKFKEGVINKCKVNLAKNLLSSSPIDSTLNVTFDIELVEALREIKYLKTLGEEENIPEYALKVYVKNEILRQHRLKLLQIAMNYNYVKTKSKMVEYPLISNVVQVFDGNIEPAIKTLTWENDITDFLDGNLLTISDLKKRLVMTQDHFETIKELIGQWKETPLYVRKERKNDNMLNLDDREHLTLNRYNQMKTAGQKITSLIGENKILFQVNESTTPNWLNYIEYVEDNVIDGLLDTVKCSLSYLVKQTEIAKVDNPLLLAKLMLVGNHFYYTPAMKETLPESLLDLVDSLIQDIMCQSKQIDRIAVHRGTGSFQDHINNCEIVVTLTHDIAFSVRNAMKQAEEYRVALQAKYSVFWSEDRKEFIRQFVRFGRLLTKEDFGLTGEIEAMEIPPTLEQFKEQIMKYDLTYEDVEKIEDVKIFDFWLKIEIKPFKQALLNVIKLWGNEFKNFLYDHVTNTLVNLESFVKESGIELTLDDQQEVSFKDLVRVLERLKKIRENEDAIDSCFEPTRDTVVLLREFGEELPEDVSKLLETLPEQWQELKNHAVLTKQAIQPLQEKEVQNIRQKCIQHDENSKNLRAKFLKAEVFYMSCEKPYDALDDWNKQITETEHGVDEVHESAAIFEVRDIPNYMELKSTRRDIRILKQLWDFVNYFHFYVIAWKESQWKNIDFSQIDEIIREVTLEIRTMDKDIKKWPLFQSLESLLKETNASVQAVRDLQDPAVKDRHWKELMQETGKDIKISDETTLAQLLSLNLHKFEEEVRGVVSKAANEQKIDKDLEKIRNIWEDLVFEYDIHDRTQITLPKATEDLTQTLEETQVKVLDMIGNRDNAFFIDKINYWYATLSKTDQVLSLWFEVQRVWSGLESIFVLSDDIKVQLPNDTARFFKIDVEFKEIAKAFEATPNVIKATTDNPNLYKEIEVLRQGLTLCEKALAQYLETKRLAFPRFYFVSAADLMDIVSNGKLPMKVMKHLSKLFDSIEKLKIINDKANPLVGSHMIAKDGEVMKMSKNISLDGQVEEWLNRLLDQMLLTMRLTLADAVVTYEEKPRDQWLFDYPAQISLTGSQIGWASEVQIAFARLEEGLENAMKDYNKKQVSQLGALIQMLLTDLTSNDRQKIMTLCTIDVHNRDVVAKLISQKVDSSQGFLWLSQLRHRWDENIKDCFVNICDAQFIFAHEYLGNQPRLVITPLTDRCYITLTQSLHLCMSGAPAGPAGTGKTETTKDLGRAMGIMVYVFNCSEQMDYKSIGNIYKGLAQSGSWGCFDEFNRISVEVLSVVAVQVKVIQDAIRQKREKFNFLGEIIPLNPAVGLFITMNPGYAGRTELPENLKALFRPCAMVVPDFELICEIMLVAEGFLDARLLARKFITLYQLCKELLSKQDHYDWGLRAIKSVLVVAGTLKRADRAMGEDSVLMRALRDFNTPKIVTDDTPVFLGLIGDLFPQLNAPRQRNPKFETDVRSATEDLGLQPEDSFILKVVQLQELFNVRHSVFIVGNAGTGKSQVWKSLHNTYKLQKMKPIAVDLDPKAVTNDELFGIINPSTREWKDGLFSVIMRDLANLAHDDPKWIVLDGDIDPMWIESLNTVMDDNKILTLASNERIPLTKSMRLLFEISQLKTATPATVSRAGILYINPGDLGWQPFVHSWLDERVKSQKVLSRSERSALSICFDKYIPPCLEGVRSKFKKITPIPDISHVQMLCHLLECLLDQEKLLKSTTELTKEGYEMFFVFCCVWAFGGCLFKDQLVDHRLEFSKWWLNEFKQIKFPSSGGVFDFYFNVKTKKFTSWQTKVTKFELDSEKPLQAVLVPTVEVARISFFLDLLIPVGKPVMLIGSAGTGKSVLLQDKFENLPDKFIVKNVPFNFYTTSEMLQQVLEKSIEKKAGKNYGPPGQSQLIYFIDDLNMPEVDKYFTVQPHTLIRQHLDYSHWYDRQKLTLKIVHKTQYIAAMNPTSGSFTISPRLQRHFAVFALSFPNDEAVKTIYSTIIRQHFVAQKVSSQIARYVDQLAELSVFVHHKVAASFLPTAIKFHYIFNLRDLSNLFQGLLFATVDCLTSQVQLLRLWKHEAQRVYSDKMVEEADLELYRKLVKISIGQVFPELGDGSVHEEPNLFCHFSKGTGDKGYGPVVEYDKIVEILTDSLNLYNETFAAMNLVLFENAVCHVLRINRILEMPRGNALLIGIGGSGKQSLSKLAAFIAGLDVYQLVLRKGFTMNDLKNEMAAIYLKTGLKNMPTVFLMTDAQIADEKYLVYINDFLASGEIPDLFPDEDMDQIITGVRGECKAYGIIDTNENCWKFFIDKVRKSLKVVLCFSPVGNTIRVRARRFPALVNCTCIDWFHEWPYDALLSVSRRFLDELDLEDNTKDSISEYMAYAHTIVNEISQQYLAKDRRFNYTTPKSFLEQIDLFKKLLRNRDDEIKLKISRLVNGLERLKDASEQTKDLKVQLADQEVVVAEKTQAANELIVVVGNETEKVRAEKEIAAGEEAKVAVIKKEVEKKQRECERDLVKAEPALVAAQEALNTLNKNNLSELKALGTPPPDVVLVGQAVMVLFAMDGKLPRDRSWKAAKAGPMSKVDQFLSSLVNYDKENIHPVSKAAAQVYLKSPSFQPDIIRGKSFAAAGLCAWVINILKFHDVYCEVKPKRDALEAANEELRAASEKLEVIQKKISHLEASLEVLTSQFKAATDEKLRCQEEADFTAKTLDLANRLVNGFASENIRWANQVQELEEIANTVPGDVLITTSFISYFGYFTKFYRVQLLNEKMWPFLKEQKVRIPIRDNIDPLELLVDDAIVATWSNENLPTDRMSVENATILSFCERWPLMIDPQLQAIKWIKTKYGDDLVVVRLNQKGYLERIEKAISSGVVVLLENISEEMDPVLDPVIGRQTIKKGRAIKMGDKEIPYNENFKLILQTKLANPHYKPEMQAQTTLINFTVTRDGLEDQLLAVVVSKERPDLEKLKSDLTTQQNTFKITLKALEDSLLAKLASSDGNFLGDHSLVENLESNKKTAKEIEEKVIEAKVTEKQINIAREFYRPNAARASLIYFIMNDLNKINPMYQFSLKAFRIVFEQAIENAIEAETEKERSANLIDSISFSAFNYTTRGLFEQDKLIFMVLIVLQIQLLSKEISSKLVDFLLRYPAVPDLKSPVDFLSDLSWGGIHALIKLSEFRDLDKDVVASAKRWKAFVEIEAPEKEKFPQEWKNKTAFEKLCMMRALRPDRMTYALRHYIATTFGMKYIEGRSIEFAKSFQESGPAVPIFFILSPGVDPLKDVELLGRNIGFSTDLGNFHNISLGQGQEIVAEEALDKGAVDGHWVVLQNVHLVAKWLATLEKKLEQYSEKSHENYRVFLSAEPAGSPEFHIIPQGILENAIKITNEPPTGMHANLHKALDNFNQETLERCTKESEFKPILFSLCYFHAVVTERRKFGAQGWNRTYPFNVGDLTICVDVLFNYLEANTKVPWEDLRYLFGEIMYGGHITDDWDRTLCRTYLQEFMQPELLEGDLMFAHGFAVPPNSDYKGYHTYIDDNLPPESPYLYGLHPNAEIEFLTTTSERVFRTVFEMQPRDIDAGAGETASREEVLGNLIDELTEKSPELFNMTELQGKQAPEERTPYTVVVLQECERMNVLINELKRSLKELKLGLKGELTITGDMEVLGNSLYLDQVPLSWDKVAYPSLNPLGLWFADMLIRIKELDAWVQDFSLPGSVWLSGLFNPQSFLTAVMQQTARKNDWPLDRMCINCDVTKKQREEMGMAPREGAYVHGLFIEGARWDPQAGVITDAKLKELAPQLPVIFLKAIPVDRQDLRVTYSCPVYKTKVRGPTYVWTFNLKTKQKASKWVLGGVALLLQV